MVHTLPNSGKVAASHFRAQKVKQWCFLFFFHPHSKIFVSSASNSVFFILRMGTAFLQLRSLDHNEYFIHLFFT